MIRHFICDCEDGWILPITDICSFCKAGRKICVSELRRLERIQIREDKHRWIKRLKMEGLTQKEIVEKTLFSKQYVFWVLRKKKDKLRLQAYQLEYYHKHKLALSEDKTSV